MDERHSQVLEEIVEEYIRLARPVGSSYLAQVLPWSASSATIRNIMHDLELEGYIFQPHTSAGRVPTDRGYRHYVDQQRSKRVTAAQVDRIREDYEELTREYRHINRTLAKLVSHLSHSMAVSFNVSQQDVQEAGLTQLLNQPEGQEPGAMREVSHFLEHVDEYLGGLATDEQQTSIILIGEENYLFNAQYVSLILRTMNITPENKIVIAIIGPKRMPYRRHVGILEGVAHLLEEELS